MGDCHKGKKEKNEAAFLKAAVTLLSDGHLITKAKLDFV